PLTLTDNQLAQWLQHLAPIPHLQRIRFHTRLPIVLPARMTESLLTVLTATPLQIIIVIHANHANELDEHVCQILRRLVHQGIVVLNQSVLLRGVNDNIDALIALSETLFRAQVWPYYLHLLDRVQGAAHFEVSLSQAKTLLEQMRLQLPGYLVPKWVREVAGGFYKQPL
ncbi:MAG: EF-P beta-lysylation protein EpmB, partial [Pseudomonadota bacterium]|nr:EF-P beta-lysylation protein EpmB [Pseudomonadota bacterium]